MRAPRIRRRKASANLRRGIYVIPSLLMFFIGMEKKHLRHLEE